MKKKIYFQPAQTLRKMLSFMVFTALASSVFAQTATIKLTMLETTKEKDAVINIKANGNVTVSGAEGHHRDGVDITYHCTGGEIVFSGDITAFTADKTYFKTIELKNCSNLTKLSVGTNYFETLDLSECPMLDSLFCNDNKLTKLDLAKCPRLELVNCGTNDLTALNVSMLPQLKKLFCYKNKIADFQLGETPLLTTISCFNNKIAKLNLGKRPALTILVTDHNLLDTLDVRGCENLTILKNNSSKTKALLLGNHPNLTTLELWTNRVETLNLEGVPMLQRLYCGQNKITSLNLAKVPRLEELSCFFNQLTELDLSTIPYLKMFWCYNNKIQTLNFDDNPSINTLSFAENLISEIDITGLAELTTLFCSGNKLTTIDFSGNPLLKELECERNEIKGAGMTNMLASMPKLESPTKFVALDTSDEKNVMTTRQVALAKEKNWTPTIVKYGIPKPYAGSEVKENTVMLVFESDDKGSVACADKTIDFMEIPTDAEIELKATPQPFFELSSLSANNVDILSTLRFKVADVKLADSDRILIKAVFSAKTSAIDAAVTNSGEAFKVVRHGDFVVAETLANQNVRLFDGMGRCLQSQKSDENGNCKFDVKSLPSGVYILKGEKVGSCKLAF